MTLDGSELGEMQDDKGLADKLDGVWMGGRWTSSELLG